MRAKKIIKSLGTIGVLAIISPSVFASGFQTSETNASGLGNAYAGGAAIAENADSEFDNPAGMVRLKNIEADVSSVAIIAHGNFKVDSMNNSLTLPGIPLPIGLKNSGINPVNPLDTNYLPALHVVIPINNKFVFGFGATVPFGYSTDYGESALSSNFATKSYIKTINLNPSLAYKINDKLSVGLGVSAQYLKAELNRTLIAGIGIPNIFSLDANSNLYTTADDWGFGWNLGFLYQHDDCTRFGLAYRSSINHSPSGDMKWKGNININVIPAPFTFSFSQPFDLVWDAATKINLPETVLLSGYHDFTSRIAGMASIQYTHWSRFDKLNLHFSEGTFKLNDLSLQENFRDTWRFSLGGNYRINDHWMWRLGAAYDQSPVTDSNRTIPLPDGDRTWLATGIQYTFNHYLSADAGYAHIFIKSGSVNTNDPIVGNIKGTYDRNYANLLGLQLNVKFN